MYICLSEFPIYQSRDKVLTVRSWYCFSGIPHIKSLSHTILNLILTAQYNHMNFVAEGLCQLMHT